MIDIKLDECETKIETTFNYHDEKIASKDITNYSDYNLLFDEEVSLLGDGFHSKTTTTESRFDTHPRTLIYYVIMATSLAANFIFLGQIWLSVINIFIHSTVLIIGAFMKFSKKLVQKKVYYLERDASTVSPKQEQENVDKLSCEEIKLQKSDKHFKHSYTNAMNWMFGISNTYGTVPTWLSWFLPGLMLYCEIVLFIILIVWGNETAPGRYCKHGYPSHTDPDFKTGGCFIQKEVALFFGLCALLGIILSLGTLYDISPQSMKSIELAKKRIINLFDANPFKHDYFAQIEVVQKRFVKPLWKHKLFVMMLIVISVWSIHLLYWEPVLIFKISKQYIAAAIVLYIFTVIGFIVSSYCIIESMYTNKNAYKYYWVIMQMFVRPLRVTQMDDIRIWMEMRKLYMNYYMVIYFGLSNGVVVSYVVIEVICVLVGVFWTFVSGLYLFSVPTLAVFVAGVIFTGYVLRIFAMCADISNIKKSHISMLQQEQQRIRWKLCKKNDDDIDDDSSGEIIKAIDDVCEELRLHDKTPQIVGIPMTWSLYNIMLAYAVSGCVSILSATLFTSD